MRLVVIFHFNVGLFQLSKESTATDLILLKFKSTFKAKALLLHQAQGHFFIFDVLLS
jgi:hypothetical protein